MRDDMTAQEFNRIYTDIKERLARMDKKRDDLIKAGLARSAPMAPVSPTN